MAEASTRPLASFGGAALPGRYGSAGDPGVTFAVVPPCRQTVVACRRGRAGALAEACRRRGVTLPAPGRAMIARDLTLLAVGPGQWLALDAAIHTDPVGRLFDPLFDVCASIRVDDGREILEVGGPAARPALAKLLTIDLHPRVFGSGAAAVTLAGSMSVLLWQIDDTPLFRLAVPRSTAGSVWHLLTDAAAEFGYVVEGEVTVAAATQAS